MTEHHGAIQYVNIVGLKDVGMLCLPVPFGGITTTENRLNGEHA